MCATRRMPAVKPPASMPTVPDQVTRTGRTVPVDEHLGDVDRLLPQQGLAGAEAAQDALQIADGAGGDEQVRQHGDPQPRVEHREERGVGGPQVGDRGRYRRTTEATPGVGPDDVAVAARVLAAALELAGRADAVRRRAVPPTPERS